MYNINVFFYFPFKSFTQIDHNFIDHQVRCIFSDEDKKKYTFWKSFLLILVVYLTISSIYLHSRLLSEY